MRASREARDLTAHPQFWVDINGANEKFWEVSGDVLVLRRVTSADVFWAARMEHPWNVLQHLGDLVLALWQPEGR